MLAIESNGTCGVRGSLGGNPVHLERLTRELDLHPTDAAPSQPDWPDDGPDNGPDDGLETIRGQVRFRRLDELMMELRGAALSVGDDALANKFERGAESMRHGIVFANSLYL